jgi:replicative DNA helicase
MSKNNQANDTKERLRGMLPEYLETIGVSPDKLFRCLNPDHNDEHPSMSFNKKDGQHVHCFSCGANWDIFDLVAVHELNADIADTPDGPKPDYNFTEAYNTALDVLSVPGNKLKSSQNHAKNERSHHLTQNLNTVKYAEWLLISDDTTIPGNVNQNLTVDGIKHRQEGRDYLSKRGLSLNIAHRFHLGYIPAWQSPTAIANGADPAKLPKTPRLIIPTGDGSYIARDTRDNIPDNQQKYKKVKEGRVHIFNEQALEENQPIFIVEGEIDALSIMETGHAQAIGLGSVANINIFKQAIKRAKKQRPDDFYPTMLIALDNDKAGKQATNKLTAMLDSLHVTNYTVNVARGCKDANEALINDRDQFIRDIDSILKDPGNRLQGLLDYINDRQDIDAIPTGFNNLDKVLDGGLYEGLYGIGAISSLGKTTFALQIADNIAKVVKRPVLYYALEMGTYEMMAKSISRITFENAHGKEILSQGTRSILKGHWKERFNKEQYQNLVGAIQEYGDFYSNVIIHDGSEERPTIEDITNSVSAYVARTGKKPVVIIDYLQIMKPMDDRATDKANVTTSVNGMKKLATKFHIPVIVISSFNRMNYRNSVSMEAFKESGEIEYSTDVLIGLQFKGVGTENFDVNEAKKQTPRQVEAVILKNRNGATGDTLNFCYYSMFNKFLDIDSKLTEPVKDVSKVNTQIDAQGRVTSSESV